MSRPLHFKRKKLFQRAAQIGTTGWKHHEFQASDDQLQGIDNRQELKKTWTKFGKTEGAEQIAREHKRPI
jgi:hypothetical protein